MTQTHSGRQAPNKEDALRKRVPEIQRWFGFTGALGSGQLEALDKTLCELPGYGVQFCLTRLRDAADTPTKRLCN